MKKKWFKKGSAVLLATAMALSLFPEMKGKLATVQAAENEAPSSDYWTDVAGLKGFNLDDKEDTVVKIRFGLKGVSAREWAICGVDTDGSLALLSTSEFAKAAYGSLAMYSQCNFVTDISKYVDANNNNSTYLGTSYFSEEEIEKMADVTVKSNESRGSKIEIGVEVNEKKLYLPNSEDENSYYQSKIYVGGNNDIAIVDNRLLLEEGFPQNDFWLRSPYTNENGITLTHSFNRVLSRDVGEEDVSVLPAMNLNLSSVLFASAAEAATAENSGYKANGSMSANTYTLRYASDGTEAAVISTDRAKVTVTNANNKYLMVQNSTGVYAMPITSDNQTVNASDIQMGSEATDKLETFNNCKVWIESTDTDRITTVKPATRVNVKINSVAVTDITAPVADSALDTEAACATEGVSSITPTVEWKRNGETVTGNAGYNTLYTASVTLTAEDGYEFTADTTATIDGNAATVVCNSEEGTLTVTYTYSKTSECKRHSYDNGFCTRDGCLSYEPAKEENDLYDIDADGVKDKVYEISNAGQLYWFSNLVNTSESGTEINGMLKEDINLNPEYSFTFDLDTGLVAVKKGEEIEGYIGTATKGDESGKNEIFDSSPSKRGVIYESNNSDNEATETLKLRSWIPIGTYEKMYFGTFDGNGKEISGIYCNERKKYIGLFGAAGKDQKDEENTKKTTIKDINVLHSCIVNDSLVVGGVCGGLTSCDLVKCNNQGIVIGKSVGGGVCGTSSLESKISECTNNGNVIGEEKININADDSENVEGVFFGGVCGCSFGEITKCSNYGQISGGYGIGGVCGINVKGDLFECFNQGKVRGEMNIGGVSGGSDGSNVENCYNQGEVRGESSVGGVIGYFQKNKRICEIKNCYYLSGCALAGDNRDIEQFGIGKDEIITNPPDQLNCTEGKTYAEFADGSVAWLLNTTGKITDDADYLYSGIWSQNEKNPIFADDNNKAVYKVKITGAVDKAYYRKKGETFIVPETIHCQDGSQSVVVTEDCMECKADAAIVGVKPIVTDTITFDYKVTVAKALNPSLVISLSQTPVTLTADGSENVNSDYMGYSFQFDGILPQQMTAKITAVLKINKEEYAKKTDYSVQTYVYNCFGTNDNEALTRFLVNMLYYGAAVQQYLGQTENLATDGLTNYIAEDSINEYRTSETAWLSLTPTSVKNVSKDIEGDLINWTLAELLLDKTITMRFTYEVPTALQNSITGCYFDNSRGESVSIDSAREFQTNSDLGTHSYYIDFTGFSPTQYGEVVTICLKNSSNEKVSETLTYSVLSYIKSMKKNPVLPDDEKLQTLLWALYDYYLSGEAYKESIHVD